MERVYQNLIQFDLINKFNFAKITNIPKLERLVLTISIRNTEYEFASVFPKALLLLELITAQKSYIKRYQTTIKGKVKKQVVFVSQVSLRNELLINFIYFFFNYIFLDLQNKFLSINKTISKAGYSFAIKDVSIFPGIAENFLKWIYPVHFLFKTNSKNIEHSSIIFRNFSFTNG